jgi:hypothetical protein
MALLKMMAGIDMTLEQITTTMISLAQQGSVAAHQVGTLYNHVVDRKLADLAGYGDARSYFNKHVKVLSQTTLSLYGSVARKFSEEVCAQYGMYRLRALLSYAEATGTQLGDPGPTVIDVPQDDDTVVRKPFAECSVDEVERATRAKKAPEKVSVPLPDRARLLFMEDSLRRNFDGVSPVRLTSRSDGTQTFINLQDVPMTQVPLLMRALQEGLDAQPSLVAR